jgi:hypothetical protein
MAFGRIICGIMYLLEKSWEVRKVRNADSYFAKLLFRNNPHLVEIIITSERLTLFYLLKTLHQPLREWKIRKRKGKLKWTKR